MPSVILYIETNFLMSHSLGRDSSTDTILLDPQLDIRLAIPSVCILEALTTFEGTRKRHNAQVVELERQVREIKRNKVFARVESLVDQLEQSVVDLGDIFNQSRTRLVEALEKLRTSAELIELSSTILNEGLNRPLINEPTDSLILASTLDHARLHESDEKIFLSENRRDFDHQAYPKAALQQAGIKYFELASRFLEWRQSRDEA